MLKKTMKRVFPLVLVAAVAFGLVWVFFLAPSFESGPVAMTQPGVPPISWEPDHLVVILPPGEFAKLTSTITIRSLIPATILELVPSLEAYVSLAPSSLPALPGGAMQTFIVSLSVPLGAPPRTIDGTLHLRSGAETIARPLPITLHIVDGELLTNDSGGYSLVTPKDWNSSQGVLGLGSTTLTPPDKAPDPDLEYVGDIVVEVSPNPGDLSLSDFYQQAGQVNLFLVAQNSIPFQINGLEAVRFADVPGHLPSTIVSVALDDQVLEFTDVNQSHQQDGIFDQTVASLLPVR